MATRTFKILVHDGREEPTVEVTVPLKLARWAVSLLPVVNGLINRQTAPGSDGEQEVPSAGSGGATKPWPTTGPIGEIDLKALRDLLDEGFTELEQMEPMDLVKVNDGDSKVRICIE